MTAPTPAERRADEVLAEQRAKGRAKYGKGLDHTEARDWNRMALEELADAVQYLAAENLRLRKAMRADAVLATLDALDDEVRRLTADDAWSASAINGAATTMHLVRTRLQALLAPAEAPAP